MKNTFLNNIRRGLGKAYIELRDSNYKEEYLDTLIFACTHVCAYELIFEGPKSEYLYKLIKLYNDDIQNKIKDIIVNSLSIKDIRGLVFQKLDLLMCYFKDGNTDILNNISNYYYKFIKKTIKWDKYRLSAFEIVLIIMDRAFGLKKTKEMLQFIKTKKLNYDYFGWYFAIIRMRYKKDEKIQELTNITNDFKENDDVFTLENLLNTEDEVYALIYAYKINEIEFNKTIDYLKSTDDIKNIKKILKSYFDIDNNIKNKLPIDVLFLLLEKYGDEVSNKVYNILMHYKSQKVRKLGLKLINDKKYLNYGLAMLFYNYNESDAKFIINAYKKVSFTFDKYNFITSETIKFMDNRKKNYPEEILFINYQKSYDSFDREEIVRIMKKRNILSTSLIEECKYDFNYDISKTAQKW